MQLKEFDIILDIKRQNKAGNFEVVQGDSYSNVLNIVLVDGINPFILTGTNVEIVFSKPDGTTVQQTDITVVNELQGKIQCVLKTNTIASPGKVIAEVRVLEGETLLTTARFEFYVRRSLINDETIESTNEFPILTQLVNDVGGIVDAVPVIQDKLDEITNTESGLNQSIQEGNTLKIGLDNSIADANTAKTNLDNSIVEGNTLKDDLYDIISGTDFEQVITDLNNKADKEAVGELSNLSTTNKSNIVNAINEVNNKSVDLTPVEGRIDDLENELDTHKAESVTQGNPHGIDAKANKSDIVQTDEVNSSTKYPSAAVTYALGQEIDKLNADIIFIVIPIAQPYIFSYDNIAFVMFGRNNDNRKGMYFLDGFGGVNAFTTATNVTVEVTAKTATITNNGANTIHCMVIKR